MSEWALRRFWQAAEVIRKDDGFHVRLDGRPVRTPGKRVLSLPTEEMAEAIAEEWRAQEKMVDPRTMPWTRSANSALDKVSVQREEVIDHLVGYAETDLLSYRAEGPEELVARQIASWDPLLDWLKQRYDAALAVTSGVMPVPQEQEMISRLRQTMVPMSDFALTGFHDLVTLPGSFVIGLAAANELQPIEDLWSRSRIDEIFQAEEWGHDEEAEEVAERKRRDFLHAYRFFKAAQT